MRYLGLALFAEGSTDYQFFPPVLRRVTEELCLRNARFSVEISEVLRLYTPKDYRDSDLTTQILSASREALGAFNILFIHTDGAGDSLAAYEERVKPARDRILTDLGKQQERIVGVVPVREMEAWTLVDGEALRGAFGTVLNDEALGIPKRTRDVEGIFDPKQVLEQAYGKVVGSRRRSKRKVADFFDAIGERVRLERLREVPAYQDFEKELQTALIELGYFS
ncbi:DUF4276 family protein [Aetokthonos hydrillicola Thurmond2011]|jgi:hypothetical protein|uniref:DUF4276 family protein n=1 Tax=Aetokthonos hydrillicola Thurmond2011 TaxID=2712845 RepID=A0AAP5I3W6_9CYAN|nr:DUF4276 family protein [Aetokthonos hydrillicola]MDR9894284.1 DUF4276 family protein [Aetokthonos hydrillicola Thurmond2011]